MLVLHLSDIHFRKGKSGSAMDPDHHLRTEILRDVESKLEEIGEKPESILVSGDIAFAGHADEYKYALKWFEELSEVCDTELKQIFICPGNHDVDRAVTQKYAVRGLHETIKNADNMSVESIITGMLNEEEAGRSLYKAIDNYNYFAQSLFCELSPPENTRVSKDLKLNDGSILRLHALNSALVSGSDFENEEGNLYVDQSYRTITKEAGVEHLVICHHPFNWLGNGVALRDHLNDVAKLQLFGHEHTNRIELVRDYVRFAASAAHPDRQEQGWEPGYNIIKLLVDGTGNNRKLKIDAHVRVWQQGPGQFRAKMDKESEIFSWEINLEPWERANSQEHSDHEGSNAVASEDKEQEDPMANLRDVSVKFFKLPYSKKLEIAGKLGLFEEEDMNKPDFIRFRSVLLRAQNNGLLEALEKEISDASNPK